MRYIVWLIWIGLIIASASITQAENNQSIDNNNPVFKPFPAASTVHLTSDTQKQVGCGIVDSDTLLDYPVDPETFTLIQPFGRPNSRYSGRFHAGDDWIKRQGETFGEPVYAIAPGLVTFSDTAGWGRDKGVVIVQHTFPDSSVEYSLYGHLEETETIKFPQRNTCINMGDVVGVISEPRPAPHLHFEIRDFWGGVPGPGYWDVDPTIQGWENPRQFIENWRAWLQPGHLWHQNLLDSTGPQVDSLFREDGTVMLVDGNYLKAYTATGQVVWQQRLADSIEAVGLSHFDAQAILLAAADGRVQFWRQYGGYIDQWETGLPGILSGPYRLNDLIVLHDTENTLHLFTTDRTPVTQYNNINPIIDYAITEQSAAFLTRENMVLVLDSTGEEINRFPVRANSALAAAPDGSIILRNQGQLVRIALDGSVAPILNDFTVNRTDSPIMVESAGNIVLFGVNNPNQLTALSPEGEIIWEQELPIRVTQPRLLEPTACTLALVDRSGYVFIIDRVTGELASSLNLWGTYRNGVWAGSHPADNLLRIHLGNQLSLYDVEILSERSC